MQFVQPWTKFKNIFGISMGKNTQYLKVCKNPVYKDYYDQLMQTNRRDFNFTPDKRISITFDEVSKDMLKLYSEFYGHVVQIVKFVQDISPYDNAIQNYSMKTVNVVGQNLPQQVKGQFNKVRDQWYNLFVTVFKYKLKTGLIQFGEIPSIINLLQDEKVLMQAFKQTEDSEKSQNQSIADEIEFMRVFIESAKDDPTYKDDEQFKQFESLMTNLPSTSQPNNFLQEQK